MDWFRRNWPDLLIGIALVAVIAGIIATLITGGSFFPVGQNAGRTPPPGQSSSVTPGTTTPGTTAPGNTGRSADQPDVSTTTEGTGSTTATSGTSDASTGAASATGSSNTGSSAIPSAATGISVLPPADSGSPAPGGTAPAATPPASSTSSAAATPAAPATTTSSSAATTTGASTADGPGSDAPYRISVGAFGQLANAQAQQAAFRAAGYTVFLAEQGDLNLVLVGPYANEAAAEAAADKIRAGGFGVDPVIYRFRGDEDSAPPPVVASSPAPTATASSNASPAPTQAAPTSASGRYIQVGAYGNAVSAQPQSERMTAMGYRVTERTEGELVKLLIGPFDGARVTEVKAQLDAAGIESFVR